MCIRDRFEKEVEQAEDWLNQIKRHEEGQKRIKELKEEERKLAAEYEKLESELYLTEQFIRSKVKLLEDKINSRFQYARFKLFEVQVNGAVVETCVTLYQGVPYPDLNGAAKINIGLDIINTLSEFYGFAAPIFIDNREAVTKLIPTKAQVISLIAVSYTHLDVYKRQTSMSNCIGRNDVNCFSRFAEILAMVM